MPPLPGENRLLTVFADVHYYFSQPSPQPQQHRFDKGSYLYIYHDGAPQSSRIEIANNPGMREQDAFCGTLNSVHVRNSDKFPTLFTLTVENVTSPSSGQPPNDNDWRLMCINPHDRSGAFLRIHTLDIYLWTMDDAKLFLTNIQRLLSPRQLDVMALPQPAPHNASTSAVVQQLENAAISDPTYQNTQREPQTSVTSNMLPPPPPPPPLASSAMAPASASNTTSEPPLEDTRKDSPEKFAPLPYNPAAPAAPEPIKHREKTPPPPDTAPSPGLSTEGTAHHGMAFAPPPPQPQDSLGSDHSQSHQIQNQGSNQGYNPAGATYGSTRGSFSQSPPVSSYNPRNSSSGSLSFAPPPVTAASPPPPSITSQSSGMNFAPPPQDPNAHLYRQQSFGQPVSPPTYNPSQHQQQPSHTDRRDSQIQGGYANYSYSQQQRQSQPGNPYDIHAQVYRPTDTEAISSKAAAHESEQSQRAGPKTGKITENAMRVEKGVNRLFKKIEKRL